MFIKIMDQVKAIHQSWCIYDEHCTTCLCDVVLRINEIPMHTSAFHHLQHYMTRASYKRQVFRVKKLVGRQWGAPKLADSSVFKQYSSYCV